MVTGDTLPIERFGRRNTARRGAFTLAELVVSLAIMGLMVVTAGQVFTLTLGSTGKATALTKASKALRALESSLRTDLAAVDPKASMMVIEAHSINAYWMEAGREVDVDGDPSTGYPHAADPEREDMSGDLIPPRADVLMFFTAASATAYSDPSVLGTTQVVTYGHAALGELDSAGAWSASQTAFPTTPNAVSSVPAQNWHLARRSVLLVPTIPSPINPFGNDLNDDPNDPDDLVDLGPFAIRNGLLDIVGNASNYLFSQNYASYTGTNSNTDWVVDPSWYARSELDTTPPAMQAVRLGHYFLPGCASFKVEWTIDDPRLVGEDQVFWFDPGYRKDPGDATDVDDKLGELFNVINDASIDPARATRLAALRGELLRRFEGRPLEQVPLDTTLLPLPIVGRPVWVDVDPATLNPNSPTSGAADPFFPSALRITVDLVDSEARFDRPLRHVMIIPVG